MSKGSPEQSTTNNASPVHRPAEVIDPQELADAIAHAGVLKVPETTTTVISPEQPHTRTMQETTWEAASLENEKELAYLEIVLNLRDAEAKAIQLSRKGQRVAEKEFQEVQEELRKAQGAYQEAKAGLPEHSRYRDAALSYDDCVKRYNELKGIDSSPIVVEPDQAQGGERGGSDTELTDDSDDVSHGGAAAEPDTTASNPETLSSEPAVGLERDRVVVPEELNYRNGEYIGGYGSSENPNVLSAEESGLIERGKDPKNIASMWPDELSRYAEARRKADRLASEVKPGNRVNQEPEPSVNLPNVVVPEELNYLNGEYVGQPRDPETVARIKAMSDGAKKLLKQIYTGVKDGAAWTWRGVGVVAKEVPPILQDLGGLGVDVARGVVGVAGVAKELTKAGVRLGIEKSGLDVHVPNMFDHMRAAFNDRLARWHTVGAMKRKLKSEEWSKTANDIQAAMGQEINLRKREKLMKKYEKAQRAAEKWARRTDKRNDRRTHFEERRGELCTRMYERISEKMAPYEGKLALLEQERNRGSGYLADVHNDLDILRKNRLKLLAILGQVDKSKRGRLRQMIKTNRDKARDAAADERLIKNGLRKIDKAARRYNKPVKRWQKRRDRIAVLAWRRADVDTSIKRPSP